MPPSSGCDGGADILFVVDVSGSIHRPVFQEYQTFIADMVLQYDVDEERADKTQFAVISFADTATIDFYFDTYE